MVLNVFSASTRSTGSVLLSSNISYKAWIAPSLPASYPAHNCKDRGSLMNLSSPVDTIYQGVRK